MSIIMVSLIFYAFCFKSPIRGRKLRSKRSITVEPVPEVQLQARRPTLLSDTHKTIAEEAREASVKQKIRKNNSIKLQDQEKKVIKKREEKLEGQSDAKEDANVLEHQIQIESDKEETKKDIPKVFQTKAQIHAEDSSDHDSKKNQNQVEDTKDSTLIENISMLELIEETLEKDVEEHDFGQTHVTPDQNPSTETSEDVKINMEISVEPSNDRFENFQTSETTKINEETEDRKTDESKRVSSKIPVPVHSSQSSSAESIGSKSSNKDRKLSDITKNNKF